ncbi:MAG: ABC transporter permease [Acidobacteriota bacterium]
MFDLETWQEIFDTVRRNKLRTFLTGFSVAWGIFMLVVLLGSGRGLENGVSYQFRDDAVNSIWVRSGQTSAPYHGLKPGRRVQFHNTDVEEVRSGVKGVEHITGRFFLGNPRVRYGRESASFDVRCVHPDHLYLEKTIVVEGRFLDDSDLAELRKVAVIGLKVRDALFKKEDPIGRQIEVNGIAFKVVGVFDDEGGEGELEKIYLPITTAQRTYNGQDQVGMYMFTTGDLPFETTEAMADEVKQRMAARHAFDPDDQRAIFVNNNNKHFRRFQNLMGGIRMFIWLIGAGTIVAGVVGVSNIMMIAVRERTREIGVRKALGATPGSILRLVMQEAVLLTAISGYLGLVGGVMVLEVGARHLPSAEFFRNPSVDLGVALQATALLVLAGALAGLIPARRAASVRPIEALRDE